MMEARKQKAVPRDEYRQVLSRLDLLERDVVLIKEGQAQMRAEFREDQAQMRAEFRGELGELRGELGELRGLCSSPDLLPFFTSPLFSGPAFAFDGRLGYNCARLALRSSTSVAISSYPAIRYLTP